MARLSQDAKNALDFYERRTIPGLYAGAAPATLHPAELLGGLTNQVYSLIGLVLIANLTKSPLILPRIRSHVTGGRTMPMSNIFDVNRLTEVLTTAGVALLHAPSGSRGWRPMLPIAPLNCYLNYLSLRRRGCLGPHALEEAVYRALSPAPAIREAIEAERQRLGDSYGCLHPRIERDMAMNWRYTEGAAPPPKLADTLTRMAAVPELTRTRRIFVAAGHVASDDDAKLLTRRTAWGASLVRRRGDSVPEASFSGAWVGSSNTSSYAAASLVDFEICRRAAWFVGWCGSTFSNWLARRRAADGLPEWYNSCPTDPPGLTQRRDGGLLVDLCPAKLNRSGRTRFMGDPQRPCPMPLGDHRVLVARLQRTWVG